MYCMHCGNPLPDKAEYCPNCGYLFAEREKKAVERKPYSPAQSFNQTPVQVPVQVNNYGANPDQSNGFAVAGFVLCFFSTIFGLVFGGIGLSKSKSRNGNGKGLSVAAIVISILRIVIYVGAYLLIYLLAEYPIEEYDYPNWLYSLLYQ